MNQTELIANQFEKLGLPTSEDYIVSQIRKALPCEVAELDCPLDSRELFIDDVIERVWDENEDTAEEFVDWILKECTN
jgi:hypothetical protein